MKVQNNIFASSVKIHLTALTFRLGSIKYNNNYQNILNCKEFCEKCKSINKQLTTSAFAYEQIGFVKKIDTTLLENTN